MCTYTHICKPRGAKHTKLYTLSKHSILEPHFQPNSLGYPFDCFHISFAYFGLSCWYSGNFFSIFEAKYIFRWKCAINLNATTKTMSG